MGHMQEDGNTEGRKQLYRQAPAKLREALACLSRIADPPLTAVLHLGDIINGNETLEQSIKELDLIADIFHKGLGPAGIPAIHVVGNHCLSAGRAKLLQTLEVPSPGYYAVPLPSGWRLLVLDTTEMSGHSGYSVDSWQQQEAWDYVEKHPMSDDNPQMSDWNGGISQLQMQWLKDQLLDAEQQGQAVILASHHQVGEGASRRTHLAWNHKAIRECLLSSPAFRLALAGHDHVGGYKAYGPDRHFVTLEALLEAPPGTNSWGVLRVFENHIEISGEGTLTSRKLQV
jgi:manganese-dependent ADP-ribose/CDP-alcohol diphosphatase